MPQNFTLEIGEPAPSDKPCRGSNLRFLGHTLKPTWDGITGKGQEDFPETFPPIWATWQIHCLVDWGSKEDPNERNTDFLHVLSLAIQGANRNEDAGFTVSYTRTAQPQILQFEPRYIDRPDTYFINEHWRSRSQSIRTIEVGESTESFIHSTDSKQKTLKSHVESLTQYVLDTVRAVKTSATKAFQTCHRRVKAFKAKVHKVMASMCPEQRKQGYLSTFSSASTSTANGPLRASPDRLTHAPTPASTRSIHPTTVPDFQHDTIDSPNTPPTPTDSPLPPTYSHSPHTSSPVNPFHFLKLLFLALALFSLLTWIIIRLRDPRRRVERAARREERRNKKLYRRAAWAHWWQTRICTLRHRNCPRSRGTGTSDTWDEKRTRVLQQEGILEAVCQEDIRQLRVATRPRRTGTSTIAAAEEGRNTFVYDSDSEAGSARRLRSVSGRSVSTLPGYESEATQPPGYATDDITPDSSVVSTSPRVSRDGGLGSEDDLWAKDIEGLDLGPGMVQRN